VRVRRQYRGGGTVTVSDEFLQNRRTCGQAPEPAPGSLAWREQREQRKLRNVSLNKNVVPSGTTEGGAPVGYIVVPTNTGVLTTPTPSHVVDEQPKEVVANEKLDEGQIMEMFKAELILQTSGLKATIDSQNSEILALRSKIQRQHSELQIMREQYDKCKIVCNTRVQDAYMETNNMKEKLAQRTEYERHMQNAWDLEREENNTTIKLLRDDNIALQMRVNQLESDGAAHNKYMQSSWQTYCDSVHQIMGGNMDAVAFQVETHKKMEHLESECARKGKELELQQMMLQDIHEDQELRLQHMQEDIRCNVCFEDYSDNVVPVVANCGHSVCKGCYTQLRGGCATSDHRGGSIVRRSAFKCPMCKKEQMGDPITNYSLMQVSSRFQTCPSFAAREADELRDVMIVANRNNLTKPTTNDQKNEASAGPALPQSPRWDVSHLSEL